jgi:hypothetical protein
MNEWLIVGVLAILLLIFIQLDRSKPVENPFQSTNPVISRSLPHSN